MLAAHIRTTLGRSNTFAAIVTMSITLLCALVLCV